MIIKYQDRYCGNAVLRTFRDGTAALKVSVLGKTISNKTYSTLRGARIAPGRFSDTWREYDRTGGGVR